MRYDIRLIYKAHNYELQFLAKNIDIKFIIFRDDNDTNHDL